MAAFMSVQSFSRCCSSFFCWSGGLCDIKISFDSFDTTGGSTFSDGSCEFGDYAASLDVAIFNTACDRDVRSRPVAPGDWFNLPPLGARWFEPTVHLAAFPFRLPTSYAGLSALLDCTWGLSPHCREFIYGFICSETESAAWRAMGLGHGALVIRVTVKLVSFVAFDAADVVSDEEKLAFEEKTEASASARARARARAGEGACAVCLEEMEEGKAVERLRCGHAFDKSCISRWLETSKQCPLCRTDVE